MLVILNSLNVRNFPIFQPILMILVSKFMVYRALSDKIAYYRVAVPFNLSLSSYEPNFRIVSRVVPEKSLTEKRERKNGQIKALISNTWLIL